MPRRHGEAKVEAALAAAGDVDERPVEDRFAVLVHVEAAQQHGLDQPSGLRDAEDQAALRGWPARQRIVAQIGEQIADARHSDRDHGRIARGIDELIDAPRLEAARERDLGRGGAVLRRHERPSAARDQFGFTVRPVALGEHGIGRAGARRRIGGAEKAGEASGGPRRVHDQLIGDLAGDRRAVLGRDRGAQHQPIVARRGGDVARPRRPRQREAVTKQKTVAGIGRRRWIVAEGGFVELTEHADIAAIVDLVEQRAVAARRRRRTQHQELGAELDQAAAVARRQRKIGDRLIGGGVRIECEEGTTAQLFVGAGTTEFGAARERLAAEDLDALDARRSRRRESGCDQEQSRDDAAMHARKVPPCEL